MWLLLAVALFYEDCLDDIQGPFTDQDGGRRAGKKEAAELKKASVHKDWLRDEVISKS
jgi:hypothetical protein